MLRTLRRTIGALALMSGVAVAQGPPIATTLTVTGSVTFPTVTAAHYDDGYVNASTSLNYTIARQGANQSRTVTLYIQALTSTLGSGKPISDLRWQRVASPGFVALTTSPVIVQGPTTFSEPGLSGTLEFRTLLQWTSTPPATYSTTVRLTIIQTVP